MSTIFEITVDRDHDQAIFEVQLEWRLTEENVNWCHNLLFSGSQSKPAALDFVGSARCGILSPLLRFDSLYYLLSKQHIHISVPNFSIIPKPYIVLLVYRNVIGPNVAFLTTTEVVRGPDEKASQHQVLQHHKSLAAPTTECTHDTMLWKIDPEILVVGIKVDFVPHVMHQGQENVRKYLL